MSRLFRPLPAAALAALAAAAVLVAPAGAQDEPVEGAGAAPPTAVTGVAFDVATTSAMLAGGVDANGRATSVAFEIGLTPSYGTTIPVPGTLDGNDEAVVFGAAGALTPGTTYHFRVVATNAAGTSLGADRTFTTAGAPPAPGEPVAPPAPAEPAPEPAVLGETVVVAPVEGTVKVQEPGTTNFVPLTPGEAVPVGTVVDARKGAVELTSAVAGGRRQTGEFGDGLFEVRQSKRGRGMTDIVLRGGNFAACRASGSVRAASAQTARKRPKRRLWARDRNGRFRTHGRNSVATVRGTRWVTTDTCAGTRTTVTEGSVTVRDLRRKRSVVVRKGKTYLARARR